MKIKNPFRLNDWDIKSFLVVILSIQLAYLGTFSMNKLGIELPFLRQILGFVYITFIPGYLLLRILKIHKLSSEESFLYAVGLSLFFDMFVGFLMNMFHPVLGITNKPISEIPIIITFVLATLVLSVFAYLRDRDYCNPDFINLKDILSPQFLFLNLIPFMAISGTYLVNYYHNNILLMVMIVVIALVVLLVGFADIIPGKLYSYAIWAIAIALILHTTLISPYIHIKDVYGEYYVANSIIHEHRWDYIKDIYANYNSVLSVTILAPNIYYICNIPLTWIYKLVFPLFLSFIPLGIYKISQRYLNAKSSFLATFLFIATKPFYINIPFLTKQLTAELFMILLIMLIVLDNNIKKEKKTILMIIFGISLIVSHYGTAYLFAGSLVFALLFLKLWRDIPDREKNNFNSFQTFVLVYSITCLTWYIYITKSSVFMSIVNLGNVILHTIFVEFFNPEYSRGAYLLTKTPLSALHLIGKSLYLLISAFIAIGVFRSFLEFILSNKSSKFDTIYLGFALYWLGILGATVVLPFFAVMNPYRLYHLALIVLFPFVIVGGIVVSDLLIKQTFKLIKMKSNNLKILYTIFVIYMLFNTSFIYQITGDYPNSISISQEYIKKYGTLNDKGFLYSTIIPTYDVSSAKWLSKHMNNYKNIYSTLGWGQGNAVLMAYGNIDNKRLQSIHYNSVKDLPNGYIYLYYFNVVEKIFLDNDPLGNPIYYNMATIYTNFIKENSKIYDNGGSQILWVY